MSASRASRTACTVSNLTRATALSMVVVPLGIVAHVLAMCALPLELCATYAREITGAGASKTGAGADDVKALVVALWGLAMSPTATRLASRDVARDVDVIKSLTARHAATVDALRAENEQCEHKFIAACKRLKEEESIRERLRNELRDARQAVVGPALARGDGDDASGGGAMFFLTAAVLGVILLYFHDITEVKHLDKKLAMWVPVAWLVVLSRSRTPRNVVTLVTAANLVLSGYFLHIVLDHKRVLGAVTHTIIG